MVSAGDAIVAPSPSASGATSGSLGEPEVQHLHGAVVAQLDVGGLEIAVDDPGLVRGLERLGDLAGDGQRLVEKQVARTTATIALCAVRFLYEQTLKQSWPTLRFVAPRRRRGDAALRDVTPFDGGASRGEPGRPKIRKTGPFWRRDRRGGQRNAGPDVRRGDRS